MIHCRLATDLSAIVICTILNLKATIKLAIVSIKRPSKRTKNKGEYAKIIFPIVFYL